MTVNRIQIRASLNDDSVVIPIGQTFDEAGREQLIETYEQTELQDNINEIIDYETTTYSHTGVVPALNPLTHDYKHTTNFGFITPLAILTLCHRHTPSVIYRITISETSKIIHQQFLQI